MNPYVQSARWQALPRALLTLSVALLSACASLSPSDQASPVDGSVWSLATRLPQADAQQAWFHQRFGNRTPTHYAATQHAGRPALLADSDGGDSLMRLRLAVDGPDMGSLRFSWFADALNPAADVSESGADDAIVRVILQFGGDRSGFSARDRRLSDLLQLITGEPLPYATLIYVWDPVKPVGTVIRHRRTDRIRKLVIRSGPDGLGQWQDFERDVTADYRLAFGQEPVRLDGIALMTDSNNTGVHSKAWYGPLTWATPSHR